MSRELPREHWNKERGRKRKAKRGFDTIRDAFAYLERHGLQDTYKAYKCNVCGKYHIGHRNKQSKRYIIYEETEFEKGSGA